MFASTSSLELVTEPQTWTTVQAKTSCQCLPAISVSTSFVVRYVVRSGIDINLPLGCIPKIQVPSTQHKFSGLHLSILARLCTNLQEGIYSIPQ